VAANPRDLSQRELDDLLDQLTQQGREESPEFRRAFKEWERRDA
jgi:hypothetical protein